MRRWFSLLSQILVMAFFATSCVTTDSSGTSAPKTATAPGVVSSTSSAAIADADVFETSSKETPTPEPVMEPVIPNTLLASERESIVVGALSPEHPFYDDVTYTDPECLTYITEIQMYDEEIDDSFVMHVSVPPSYGDGRTYPMVVMTDGVWRLGDHVELRPMMEDGRIEELILVSIGYPDGYDYDSIRERDFVNDPENFLHFVIDNLMPLLLANYSVDETDMTLTGHSYGGYWAFYSLLYCDTIGKNLFSNYVIASPAMSARTGIASANDYEQLHYDREKILPARVYVTSGGLEPSSYVMQIDAFLARLEERDYQDLDMTYEVIEGYDHNEVFKPTLTNALLLFYGKE